MDVLGARRRHPPAARSLLLVVLLALIGALLAPLTASAQTPGGPDGTGPDEQVLPEPANGPRAVRALGDRLPEVAARNGRAPGELRELLRSDPTLWVDPAGALFYVDTNLPVDDDGHRHDGDDAPGREGDHGHEHGTDEGSGDEGDHGHGHEADQGPVGAAGDLRTEKAPFPLDQTFQLNSRPGAPRVIHLDFDGHTVSGTAWNEWHGVSSGAHPPFDLDGDPSSFSAQERTFIQGVWQRVAEDYAPFDVNVTTQDPGTAAITRSSAGDQNYGTRVLISPSDQALTAICGGVCGGIAYVGVFDVVGSQHAYYQPAWVFPQTLGYGEKAVAEAATHEAGHNLGLDHHGTSTLEYYVGHGAWAPIMGGSYQRPITQWAKGEYNGANRPFQDDIATMQTFGLPLRTDDHGDTRGAATSIGSGGSGARLTGSGVISTRSDVDVFAYTQSCSGQTTMSVTPAPNSPNLDARLRVYDAGGTLLDSNDPPAGLLSFDLASGLDAHITRSQGSGTYYLAVDGVGHGSAASTGYSDYGSLGDYEIEVQPCATGTLGNDAFASAQQLTGPAGQETGTNVGATRETGEPAHAGNLGGASVWYRWTAPADGTVTIDTVGSNFDTLLGVYTGTGVSALTEVASNDDLSNESLQSRVRDVPVTKDTTYRIAVDGYNPGSGPDTGNIVLNWTFAASLYEPMNPARVLDSRDDTGDFEARIGADSTRSQKVAGVAGVPDDATAVAINVTAVGPTRSSYLTISPTGMPRPTAASLNFPAERTVGNFVIAEVGTDGKVDIYNYAGTVDVVFDVMGYFPAGTDYESMTPTRILDTRDATGDIRGTLGPATARAQTVAGVGSVPADAAAVAINMTSVSPTAGSFLTVYPTGITRPVVSSLNFRGNQTVGNLVIAEVGIDGKATIYNNSGDVHVVFDVVGYFPAGTDFQRVPPARLLDTRNTTQGDHSTPIGAEATISQKVTGRLGVPENAKAVAINITAVSPTAGSYLTFYPTGEARPTAATVNFPRGLNTNNMVLAEVGADGKIDVFNFRGNVDVVLDVVGYVPGG